MRVAKNFEIIRIIDAEKIKSIELNTKPVALYILIDEDMFEHLDYALEQDVTTVAQDEGDDWRWEKGRLYCAALSGGALALLAVHKEVEDGRLLYCSDCGAHAAQGCEHNLEAVA